MKRKIWARKRFSIFNFFFIYFRFRKYNEDFFCCCFVFVLFCFYHFSSKIYDLQNTIELDHYTFETRVNVVDAHSNRFSRSLKQRCDSWTADQSRNRSQYSNWCTYWNFVLLLLFFLFICTKVTNTSTRTTIETVLWMVSIWHLLLCIDNCLSLSI